MKHYFYWPSYNKLIFDNCTLTYDNDVILWIGCCTIQPPIKFRGSFATFFLPLIRISGNIILLLVWKWRTIIVWVDIELISARVKLEVCDVTNLPYMDINWQYISIYGYFVTSLTAYYSCGDIKYPYIIVDLCHEVTVHWILLLVLLL